MKAYALQVIGHLLDHHLAHRTALVANALGPPPPEMIDQVKGSGRIVAALAGRGVHAERHVAAGVDLIVAQGSEAGGHTGEIGSMVLIPEVVDAVAKNEEGDAHVEQSVARRVGELCARFPIY